VQHGSFINCNLHQILPIIGGNTECNGEKRNAYRTSVEKPDGKRLLGRTGHVWEDNIKKVLKEIERGLHLFSSG
jgi:hypothetical protein